MFSFAVISLMAAHAHHVLELESNTFEVTVTAYQYLAVLFYDFSDQGKHLEHIWEEAANELGDRLPEDVQMAKVASPPVQSQPPASFNQSFRIFSLRSLRTVLN